MVDPVLLIDVGGVVGGVDNRLAGRHAGPERRAGEARTDGQHEIGFGHELGDHLRPRAGRGPERERVRFGNRAFARIGGEDRRRNELGQRCETIARLRIKHALPRQQQRVFRRQQHAHRRLDRVGVGSGALHRDGSIIELARVFGLPNFGRNLDEHRPAFAAAHGMIGAAHQVGELLHRMGKRRPFGDRPVHVGGAEHRPHVLPRQRQPGRNDE
jgi:hypothetical protein